MLKDMVIPLNVSATPQVFKGEDAVLGKLYAIEYRPGTILTGATILVTTVGDATKTLLSKATAGTSNAWFYPRDIVCGTEDGAVLLGTSGGDRCLPLMRGVPTVTVTSGWASGATLVGELTLYYEE